jgi:hypothetical protein
VRIEGLEPPCLAALDPKSSASTNFATSAMDSISSGFFLVKNRSAIVDAKVRVILNFPQALKKIFVKNWMDKISASILNKIIPV